MTLLIKTLIILTAPIWVIPYCVVWVVLFILWLRANKDEDFICPFPCSNADCEDCDYYNYRNKEME